VSRRDDLEGVARDVFGWGLTNMLNILEEAGW
jgi:hypothetical protein